MGLALTSKLGVFGSLSAIDPLRVEDLCSNFRTVALRSIIVAERAYSEHLHVLLDGWAARYRVLADGRRQFSALLLPGDICDLDRLQIPTPEFGVVTLTPCTVAKVSVRGLKALADERKAIREALWRLTCLENAISSEWTVCLGQLTALERTAHLLCELDARLGAIGGVLREEYTLPMTQEELGDALGLSVVHVNRTLQTLRNKNLIHLRGRQLTILDRRALSDLCSFDPSYLHLGERVLADLTNPPLRSAMPESA